MSVQTASAPLSELQLELLKLFAMGVSDEDLQEIRRLLSNYFMQKAIDEATRVWEEKSYSAEELLSNPS